MPRTKLFACGLVVASLLVACADLDTGGSLHVDGSGTIVTESRDVTTFDRITLAGEGAVIVAEGGEPSLSVATDDNLLGHIETSVANRTLEIATEPGIDIDPTESVVYRVTTPSITGVTLSGAGSFDLGDCKADTFSVVLSGAGDITIGELNADALDVAISGAGSVFVAGKVRSQDVRLPGAGSYDAGDLESARATVSASGAGSAVVWVTAELDASVSGVGNIDYFGSPQVTQSVTGVGSVTHRGA